MLGPEVSWVSILRLGGKVGGGPSTGRLTGHTYFGNQARILISGAWGEIFSQFFSAFPRKKMHSFGRCAKVLEPHFPTSASSGQKHNYASPSPTLWPSPPPPRRIPHFHPNRFPGILHPPLLPLWLSKKVLPKHILISTPKITSCKQLLLTFRDVLSSY